MLYLTIRKVITDSGALRGVEGSSPRARSVTSAVFLTNVGIPRVLETATWGYNSVFSLFDFKDISYVLEDCRSLGPFVAVGSVLP